MPRYRVHRFWYVFADSEEEAEKRVLSGDAFPCSPVAEELPGLPLPPPLDPREDPYAAQMHLRMLTRQADWWRDHVGDDAYEAALTDAHVAVERLGPPPRDWHLRRAIEERDQLIAELERRQCL